MAVTLFQYVNDHLRWAMFEKGLQVEWNRLWQLLSSEAGSTVVGGTTVLDTLDTVDGAGGGFQKSALVGVSGPFAASGGEATVSGEKVVPAGPGGTYTPTPPRLSQQIPRAGFRVN